MNGMIKEIQDQFNEVIAYSQGTESPETDDLFNRWLEAKRDFIEAMDGKLIYEWPETVSFELSVKDRDRRVSDFIDLLETKYNNSGLANFVSEQREGFFSNQVVKSTEYRGEKIPAGMKLVKAFKFFESDSKMLVDEQNAASMIIQEDKIEGTLCFSVHPLDFLSSSENTYNWRSCHSLDGDYRAGNLSYMVDKSTVICYLKSKREEKLPNFPETVKWNSKKWRVLLFFSENFDVMFAGRQYPFSTDVGLNFIKDKILSAINLGTWAPWSGKKIKQVAHENGMTTYLNQSYVPLGNQLLGLEDVVKNGSGALQFNDVLRSSCYDPVYSVRGQYLEWMMPAEEKSVKNFHPRVKPFPKIVVGGHVLCTMCGHDPIELSQTMLCMDCELKYGHAEDDMFAICNCCGQRFIYDDGYWIDQTEETICEECAEEYTEICDSCGERYYRDSMSYDRKNGIWICSWCSEEKEN